MSTGLFIGRFQPFHIGHLKDVRDALKDMDELIIAIGSSQHSNTEENPFTVEERMRMLEDALIANNISDYTLFPVPDIGDDSKWVEHVRTLIPKFDVVYSGNPTVQKLFESRHFKVKKIKLLPNVNATTIRDKILKDQDWEKLVPNEVSSYLKKIDGIKRIKNIFSKK